MFVQVTLLSPSMIPCYIHSKMPSSLCGIQDQWIIVQRQERDPILTSLQTQAVLYSNENHLFTPFCFGLGSSSTILIPLPPSYSAWLIPVSPGKLLKCHLF